MELTTKLCHACKIIKPTKDFYKSSGSKDGLAPSCKDCQNGRTEPKRGTPQPEPEKVKLKEAIENMEKAKVKSVVAMEEYIERNTNGDSRRISNENLRAKMWVWWYDPLRDKSYHGHPRAGDIVSINHDTGTALISIYSDPSADRLEEIKLANISDLKHRIKYY